MSISIFPTGSFIEYPMCSTARMEEIKEMKLLVVIGNIHIVWQ